VPGIIAGIARGRCPTCGQRVTRSGLPRADLNSNTISRGEETHRVAPRVAELAHVLREAWPRAVKVERMIPKLWGIGREPDDVLGNLRAHAYQLNKILRRWGWEAERISGVSGVTLGGYRLVRREHVHAAARGQVSSSNGLAA
jgi:DNA-binding winged helix-turn-helix (wHTH) protein